VAINAFVAAIVATPAIGYLLSPLLRRKSSQWVRIGEVPSLGGNGPQRVDYTYRDESGYAVGQLRRRAYVVRDGEELIVLSPVCTHMGCNVAFNEATNLFECPCHGGKYNVAGTVVDGPPPRPLRRFKTRLREGALEILIT